MYSVSINLARGARSLVFLFRYSRNIVHRNRSDLPWATEKGFVKRCSDPLGGEVVMSLSLVFILIKQLMQRNRG